METRKRYVFILLFILFATLPYFLYLSASIFVDEGLFMFVGSKIVQGSIPYHDYIDSKPPGIFYLLAFVFSIFGKSMYVARATLFFFNTLSAIILFLIGKRLWNEKVGMLSSILFLIGVSIPAFHGYHVITDPFMVFFGLLAVLFFFQSKERAIYLILSGIALGLSVIFKQIAGLLLLTILFFYLSKLHIPENRTRAYLRNFIRSMSLISSGFFIPLLLVSFYFFSANALSDMIYWTIVAPIKLYGHTFELLRLGYGFVSYSVVWIFAFVSVLTICYEFITKRGVDKEIFMVIWWICSLYPLTIRQSGLYFIQILAPACLLSSMLLIKIRQMEINYLKIFSLICVFSLTFSSIGVIGYTGYLFQKGSPLYFNEQLQTANYIKSHTAENEKIFVFIYQPSIYFLSDRDPPTEHLDLFTDMFYKNRENSIIEQIRENNVKYIIMADNMGVIERMISNESSPSERALRRASHIYNFILNNYNLEESFGSYEVYKKRNIPF